jgi:hypothetical protein
MKELRSEIEIDATPAEVWAVLTDFDEYPEWNPFIRRIDGDVRPGGRLRVRIEPVGERGMTLKPTVLAVRTEREFRWLGRLLMPGIFNGEHTFRIEEIRPGRVRFVQSERFTGVLVPLLWRKLRDGGTAKGFTAMNEALMTRVADQRTAAAR